MPIDTSQLRLTFADNFDTLNLQNLSPGHGLWQASTSVVNGDQAYIDPSDAQMSAAGLNPFSVADGVLTVTAQQVTGAEKDLIGGYDYASGKLITKNTFSQQYGYFEMRAALPQGDGAWPAFWLLAQPPNPLDREFDIMEQAANGLSHQAVHYSIDGAKAVASSNTYVGDTSDFHTYGMLWSAVETAWYVDGALVYSVATPSDMNRPMYMIVNLAMGGAWAGPPDLSQGDQAMQIDYVRAYEVAPDTVAAALDPDLPHLPIKRGTGADDRIVGSSKAGWLAGLGGDDVLTGGKVSDVLDGGEGNDTLNGGGGGDVLYGGGGNDTASYADGSAVSVSLAWAGAQDTGGAGLETLFSIENLIGSELGDVLTGNNLINCLSGRGGSDLLSGGEGDDRLYGGAGADRLDGGAGDDVLDGGGADTVSYAAAEASVAIDLEIVVAQQTGGRGVDTLIAIENVIGSDFADVLSGNSASNCLYGGAATDRIEGGGGADRIEGGAGADVLTGGTGNDLFVYAEVSSSSVDAFDTVTDFVRGSDRIDLSAIDANSLIGGNQAFRFLGAAAFSGQAGQVRASATSDGLYVQADCNGDGRADFQIVLTGKLKTLTASDFIL